MQPQRRTRPLLALLALTLAALACVEIPTITPAATEPPAADPLTDPITVPIP
jgi:hypothetical protein